MTDYHDYVNAVIRLTTHGKDWERGMAAAARERDARLHDAASIHDAAIARAQRLRHSIERQYAEAVAVAHQVGEAQLLPPSVTPTTRSARTDAELASLFQAQKFAVQALRDAADHYRHEAEQARLTELARLARRRRLIIAAITAAVVLAIVLIIVIS
jgi:hypothetical protein